MDAIRKELTANRKPRMAEDSLGFGKVFTDHMFLMNYEEGKGWFDPRIVPYGPIILDPAAVCLHYGQLIFEGLKAYQAADGKIVMFRPGENMKRINRSGERLCIPSINEEFCVEALAELIRVERDWVPKSSGTSLYIRPFILSTEAFLGVHPSSTYLYCVILSPVGSYYRGGLAPVRIYVENEYVRSVKGGTGFAKCAGNYAASLRGQVDAEAQGYAQVLWLDGVERKYIEEVGSMNVFFVIDGEAVTPELGGSILPGITRKSVLEILKDWGVPTSERKISIEELAQAHRNGRLQEAFGTGTAAVISPIGELKWGDTVMRIGDGRIGPLSQRLYDEIIGIQTRQKPDPYGWVYEVV